MLVNVWGQLETISENMQRGDPWNIFENFQKYAKGGPLEKKILIFFLTLYSTLEDHMRLLECHLRVLEC